MGARIGAEYTPGKIYRPNRVFSGKNANFYPVFVVPFQVLFSKQAKTLIANNELHIVFYVNDFD